MCVTHSKVKYSFVEDTETRFRCMHRYCVSLLGHEVKCSSYYRYGHIREVLVYQGGDRALGRPDFLEQFRDDKR